jgi:hypothetical protein
MVPTRQILLTTLLLSLTLSACASLPTPAPTATATAPPATATPDTLSGPITPYADNPVFTVAEPEAWDSGAVFNPRVVFEDGIYHMFYNGSTDATLPTMAIGYAASADGRAFTRQTAEPILAGDGRGFDARQASSGVPLLEGDTWVLYYNAGGGPGPGSAIGRATAAEPAGPWNRGSQPVLLVGGPSQWDADFIIPESVLATDEGYVMYYTGGGAWPESTALIGRATSPDGITWTKYDDPATGDAPFAQSDPVLPVGPDGSWDSTSVWGCAVLKTSSGWEMFYTGSDGQQVQIGYAASPDGIHWTKFEDNPILTPVMDSLLSQDALPILQSPSVIAQGSTYIVYYDYGVSTGSIGVATGTITRRSGN